MNKTKNSTQKTTNHVARCAKEKHELHKERRQFLRNVLLIAITNIFSTMTTLLTTWLLMK